MRDVEERGASAALFGAVHDGRTVLDRHLPARERHHLAAVRHVIVVQRGALERARVTRQAASQQARQLRRWRHAATQRAAAQPGGDSLEGAHGGRWETGATRTGHAEGGQYRAICEMRSTPPAARALCPRSTRRRRPAVSSSPAAPARSIDLCCGFLLPPASLLQRTGREGGSGSLWYAAALARAQTALTLLPGAGLLLVISQRSCRRGEDL